MNHIIPFRYESYHIAHENYIDLAKSISKRLNYDATFAFLGSCLLLNASKLGNRFTGKNSSYLYPAKIELKICKNFKMNF